MMPVSLAAQLAAWGGATVIGTALRHDDLERVNHTDFPFWPMLFANITIRLLGSDDFPLAAKHPAAADLTSAANDGSLSIDIAKRLPLHEVAEAHDSVDAGAKGRVVVTVGE